MKQQTHTLSQSHIQTQKLSIPTLMNWWNFGLFENWVVAVCPCNYRLVLALTLWNEDQNWPDIRSTGHPMVCCWKTVNYNCTIIWWMSSFNVWTDKQGLKFKNLNFLEDFYSCLRITKGKWQIDVWMKIDKI